MLSVPLAILAAGTLFLATASDGQAAFKLRLTSGADTVIVSDNDVLGQAAAVPNTPDAEAAVGVISFSGSVGTFSTVISVGISKPNTGFGDTPLIELRNIDVSSGSAGTLFVELTDTGYAGATGNFVVAIGDLTTSGTVSLAAAVDINDVEFAAVEQIADIAALGPGSGLSAKTGGPAAFDGDYSVSLLAAITHNGPSVDVTSFSATVSVPEPRAMALFGIGLLGLGLLARRRARVRAWAA